jgi:hypothetical protein
VAGPGRSGFGGPSSDQGWAADSPAVHQGAVSPFRSVATAISLLRVGSTRPEVLMGNGVQDDWAKSNQRSNDVPGQVMWQRHLSRISKGHFAPSL